MSYHRFGSRYYKFNYYKSLKLNKISHIIAIETPHESRSFEMFLLCYIFGEDNDALKMLESVNRSCAISQLTQWIYPLNVLPLCSVLSGE